MTQFTDKDFEGLTPEEIIKKINSQHSPEVQKLISEVDDIWDELYGTDSVRMYPKRGSDE